MTEPLSTNPEQEQTLFNFSSVFAELPKSKVKIGDFMISPQLKRRLLTDTDGIVKKRETRRFDIQSDQLRMSLELFVPEKNEEDKEPEILAFRFQTDEGTTFNVASWDKSPDGVYRKLPVDYLIDYENTDPDKVRSFITKIEKELRSSLEDIRVLDKKPKRLRPVLISAGAGVLSLALVACDSVNTLQQNDVITSNQRTSIQEDLTILPTPPFSYGTEEKKPPPVETDPEMAQRDQGVAKLKPIQESLKKELSQVDNQILKDAFKSDGTIVLSKVYEFYLKNFMNVDDLNNYKAVLLEWVGGYLSGSDDLDKSFPDEQGVSAIQRLSQCLNLTEKIQSENWSPEQSQLAQNWKHSANAILDYLLSDPEWNTDLELFEKYYEWLESGEKAAADGNWAHFDRPEAIHISKDELDNIEQPEARSLIEKGIPYDILFLDGEAEEQYKKFLSLLSIVGKNPNWIIDTDTGSWNTEYFSPWMEDLPVTFAKGWMPLDRVKSIDDGTLRLHIELPRNRIEQTNLALGFLHDFWQNPSRDEEQRLLRAEPYATQLLSSAEEMLENGRITKNAYQALKYLSDTIKDVDHIDPKNFTDTELKMLRHAQYSGAIMSTQIENYFKIKGATIDIWDIMYGWREHRAIVMEGFLAEQMNKFGSHDTSEESKEKTPDQLFSFLEENGLPITPAETAIRIVEVSKKMGLTRRQLDMLLLVAQLDGHMTENTIAENRVFQVYLSNDGSYSINNIAKSSLDPNAPVDNLAHDPYDNFEFEQFPIFSNLFAGNSIKEGDRSFIVFYFDRAKTVPVLSLWFDTNTNPGLPTDESSPVNLQTDYAVWRSYFEGWGSRDPGPLSLSMRWGKQFYWDASGNPTGDGYRIGTQVRAAIKLLSFRPGVDDNRTLSETLAPYNISYYTPEMIGEMLKPGYSGNRLQQWSLATNGFGFPALK